MKKLMIAAMAGLLGVAASNAQNLTVEGAPVTWDNTANSYAYVWIADAPGSNGELNLINGASLTASGVIDVGNNPGAAQTAGLNVTDSTVTMTGTAKLRLNTYDGISVMTVNGSSDVTTSILEMNAGNSATHGDATLTINGGLVKATSYFDMLAANSSTLNINGGTLRVDGFYGITRTTSDVFFNGGEFQILSSAKDEAGLQAWVDDGHIDVSGAPGYQISTVDVGGTSYTTLAIPEPATIGLLGFAGLGLLAIRRRLKI